MNKELTFSDNVFNPDVIMNSGQVFRMQREGDIYSAFSGANQLQFYRTKADRFMFFCEDDQWDFWQSYFDFDTDYEKYNHAVRESKDPFLLKSLEVGKGMRILRQDLWETFVSYLISQNNNIPKIKKSIQILCDRYSDGMAFPTAEVLSAVSTEELSNGTALGYRADYISGLSKQVASGQLDLEAFRGHDWEKTVEMLLTIKGIGPKVANCIALYGLHVMDSYPIDTWMKKIISEDYSSMDQKEYMAWLHGHFAGFEGYVQQLQFYCKRK